MKSSRAIEANIRFIILLLELLKSHRIIAGDLAR